MNATETTIETPPAGLGRAAGTKNTETQKIECWQTGTVDKRSQTSPIIKIDKLRVEYRTSQRAGAKVAVQCLDLDVHAGEVFGFLGPNGAGNTTTMNVPRARNLWWAALRNWQIQESGKSVEDMDQFSFVEITSRLADLEESQENYAQALDYMEMWKSKSPKPEEVQEQIEEVRKKAGLNATR